MSLFIVLLEKYDKYLLDAKTINGYNHKATMPKRQQNVISTKISAELRDRIEQAKQAKGYYTDSSFLRDAIKSHLEHLGHR